MKAVIKGRTHERMAMIDWLVLNVGPVMVTEAQRTVGQGWEVVDQIKFYFAKDYIVYIDDPHLALTFTLKWQ